MARPDEVTRFLRCGGTNCDSTCMTIMKSVEDCLTWRVHGYVEQLEAQIPKWISVNERLPELFTKVLVIVKCKSNSEVREIKISERYTPIGCYHTEWRWGCSYNDEVTHWMELPQLPKEDNE